jgi:hypothetical protein
MAIAARSQMKRKADAGLNTQSKATKKQKKTQKQEDSDEPFHVPSDWGQKEPIGIAQAEIPLTNAEAFRLRGWYWRRSPEDLVFDCTGSVQCQGPACESPRGTKFW